MEGQSEDCPFPAEVQPRPTRSTSRNGGAVGRLPVPDLVGAVAVDSPRRNGGAVGRLPVPPFGRGAYCGVTAAMEGQSEDCPFGTYPVRGCGRSGCRNGGAVGRLPVPLATLRRRPGRGCRNGGAVGRLPVLVLKTHGRLNNCTAAMEGQSEDCPF